MQTTRQQPTAPQISCLLVPSLALAVELAERPGLGASGVGAGEQPAALADEAGLRVAEASLAALDRGVRPGQTLREAVAYCPALAVLEPRPARARQVAAQLVEAVEAISPLVEEAAPGEVYADLRGLEGLYPRPGALEQALLAAAQLGGGALGGKALGARLGVAGSRFTARAAAHAAAPGEWLRVAAAEARAFLAPLPSEWLPLEAAAQGWLRLLGLETLGDLAALPRHAVEAQFGPAGGQAWLAARGEDPTPAHAAPLPRAGDRDGAGAAAARQPGGRAAHGRAAPRGARCASRRRAAASCAPSACRPRPRTSTPGSARAC